MANKGERSMNDWEPFVYATKEYPPADELAKMHGCTVEEAQLVIDREAECDHLLNNKYEVTVDKSMKDIIWLSIKRLDKKPIHDWRDLQRIKSEIVGPEYEAMEIYPAESRVVDTANQFHLWVFNDPAYTIPVGFNDGRQVSTQEDIERLKEAGGDQRIITL